MWRVRRGVRLLGPAIAVGLFISWTTVAVVEGLPALLLVAVGSAALALGLWFPLAQRPRIVLEPPKVTVVNPAGTQVVRLADLDRAEAGPAGVDLKLRDGTTVTAWAVQRANWSPRRGSRPRADSVAAAINAAADRG